MKTSPHCQLLAFAFSCVALITLVRAQATPVVVTNLVFAAQHDPAVIKTDTGDRYSVRFHEGAWGRVDKWTAGRVLELVYDEKEGASLRDQLTKELLPLTYWPEGKHPLDLQLQSLLSSDDAASTQGIVEAYDAFIPKWEAEVSRAYAMLKVLPELSKKDRKNVEASEKAWKQFYASQTNALASVLFSRDGTIWRIAAASAHLRLVQSQAHQLYTLLDY